MKKEPYLVEHEKCGIKVGDKVKVKRKAKDFESGWNNSWVEDMNPAIAKIGKVEVDRGEYGFELYFPQIKFSGFAFPYFVLKKIKNSV